MAGPYQDHILFRSDSDGVHLRMPCVVRLLCWRAGPGAFDFKQGDTNGTLFWKVVGHFLHNPTAAQTSCQAPKPILLDTGNAHIPYEWYALSLHAIYSDVSYGLCALPLHATQISL